MCGTTMDCGFQRTAQAALFGGPIDIKNDNIAG
jgi:hypothetical protein